MIRAAGRTGTEEGDLDTGPLATRHRALTLPPLDAGHLLSYTVELREICSLASDHLLVLHESAGCWYHAAGARDAAALAGQDSLQAELHRRMQNAEHAIFRATEALLGSYVRASLLLFPEERLDPGLRKPAAVARRDWRIERGRLLRTSAGIVDGHAIGNRRIRDAWIHHDERLDEQILMGRRLMSQCFARMGEVRAEQRALYIRFFEIDPPQVVLHLPGSACSLDTIARALLDVDDHLRRFDQAGVEVEGGVSLGR